MSTVASAALAWQAAGFSTIPIIANKAQSKGLWKKPALRWKDYQTTPASLEQVSAWWANGHEYGLALIMGKVSGNAEMLEIEGRSCDGDSLTAIANAMDEAGIGHLWDLLNGAAAYSEVSPSGGLHFIYRVSDHEVPGNHPLARRPATEVELAANPDDKIKVLSETRGEGGYVIVAPTSGLCHPSGEPWVLLTGESGVVPTLTWEERNLVHAAITRALDELQSSVGSLGGERSYDRSHAVAVSMPATETSHPAGQFSYEQHSGRRPGDHFEDATDWGDADLLGGSGWSEGRPMGGARTWIRPGKDPADGISATTGHDAGRDRLYVFSTSTCFPTEQPITKFAAYAYLRHAGDMASAARELRRRGFGDGDVDQARSVHGSRAELQHRPGGPPRGGMGRPDGSHLDVGGSPDFREQTDIEEESWGKKFPMDDLGGRHYLAQELNGDVRWVSEEKAYYIWGGRAWAPDVEGHVDQAYDKMTERMCESDDSSMREWASKKLRSGTRANWVTKNLRTVPGVSVSASDFNRRDTGKLNLQNGVLDLRSGEFGPHSRELLCTRVFGASFDPQATCPNFYKFMEDAIPDEQVRAYVQRAVGYSLLGDAKERALFLVWGPSGTGKSQFMETMQHVFGGYGVTAPLGAFVGGRDAGPQAEVHALRGKRFVSTSETADNTRFNEEIVKRLTGSDTVSTRNLYQSAQEWKPECAIWIATNHKPRFSSDDDAIWRRSKLIPFTTRFGSEDAPREIVGFAEKMLFAEADGILNWMLAGLAAYLEGGLQEPEEIAEQATQHRQEVDSVASFLEDSVADGKLHRDEVGWIKSGDLYLLYTEWCRQGSEHPFGRRRFTNRVLANWAEVNAERQGGQAVLRGLRRANLLLPRGSLFTPSEQLE